ncbi:MAG: hypothetical protein AAF674_02940 [Pseudomonadota bacterium]
MDLLSHLVVANALSCGGSVIAEDLADLPLMAVRPDVAFFELNSLRRVLPLTGGGAICIPSPKLDEHPIAAREPLVLVEKGKVRDRRDCYRLRPNVIISNWRPRGSATTVKGCKGLWAAADKPDLLVQLSETVARLEQRSVWPADIVRHAWSGLPGVEVRNQRNGYGTLRLAPLTWVRGLTPSETSALALAGQLLLGRSKICRLRLPTFGIDSVSATLVFEGVMPFREPQVLSVSPTMDIHPVWHEGPTGGRLDIQIQAPMRWLDLDLQASRLTLAALEIHLPNICEPVPDEVVDPLDKYRNPLSAYEEQSGR